MSVSRTMALLSILIIISLLFSPSSTTLALDEGGSTGGPSLEGEGEGEGESAPDADGDGTSDAAEAEASQAAADAVASVAAEFGVDVSVGVVDTTNNPDAVGGSVTVDGVTMSMEAATEAIGAIAEAQALGLSPAASTGAKGIDVGATLAAHAMGDTGVVGSASGKHGTVAEVTAAEAAVAVGRSATTNSAPSTPTQRGGVTVSTLTDQQLNSYREFANLARQAGITNLSGTTRAGTQNTVNVTPARTDSTPGITPVDNLTVDARMAAAGFNPDGSVQRSVTIDYSNIMGVTTGRVSDYQKNDTLDSKIAMEQNLIGMALNSNIDQAQLGQVSPSTINNYGAIDNRDSNGAFAKSLDNSVAPSLWSDSNLAGRAQLGVSYFSNIVGYTPAQAAGIIGNFRAESGLDALEEAAGSERSSGLGQWNAARAAGERRNALEAYAGVQFSSQLQNGRHTSGPGAFTQMSFAAAEMKGTAPDHRDPQSEAVGRTFNDNPDMTPADAARIFQNGFERPADRTHSLGFRQSSAREALESYYSINPEQRNFTTTATTPSTPSATAPTAAQPAAQTAPETDTSPAVPTITISTGVQTVDRTINDTLGRVAGFINSIVGSIGNPGKTDQYASLPSSGEGGYSDIPTLEQVIVTPGRPTHCQAGPSEEGFTFSIKLVEKNQTDRAYSCKGKTTGEYFTLIAAYLRAYGIINVQQAEVLQKMQINHP